MNFVPTNFDVPTELKTNDFVVTPLLIGDLEEDYAAIMDNIEHLQGTFGDYSHWPSKDITKEQNLIDLGWHHKEFQRRTSFAYVVRNLENEYLGCVYFYPSKTDNHDVDIYAWLIKTSCDACLFDKLENVVKDWVETSWPFKAPRYLSF